MINRHINYLTIITCLFIFSCTKGFNDINTNPTSSSTPNIPGLLTKLEATATNGGITTVSINIGLLDQHFATIGDLSTSVYGFMDLYNQLISQQTSIDLIWNNAYNGAGRAEQYLYLTRDNPQLANYNALGRLFKIYFIQLVTDQYGSCPYSQVGTIFYDPTAIFPVYDLQSNIYYAFLQQLNTIGQQINPNITIQGDISTFYGNPLSWQKIVYEMMVQVAMRLTKIQPDTAAKYVQIAYQKGNLVPSSDYISNSLVIRSNGTPGSTYLGRYYPAFSSDGQLPAESYWWQLSATYFNNLRTGNGQIGANYQGDPRLFLVPGVYPPGKSFGPSTYSSPFTDTSANNLLGVVNGRGTAAGSINATINPYYFTYNSPTPMIFNSQIQFLLAEAAERGYLTNMGVSNGTDFFTNGVISAINEVNLYGSITSASNFITSTFLPSGYNIPAYAGSFNYASLSKQDRVKAINRMYWLSCFLLWPEAWANWRRTRAPDNPNGTPLLITPSNGGGLTNGQIPTRLVYPLTELTNNPKNLQSAINQQGADNFITRVWWDPIDKNFLP